MMLAGEARLPPTVNQDEAAFWPNTSVAKLGRPFKKASPRTLVREETKRLYAQGLGRDEVLEALKASFPNIKEPTLRVYFYTFKPDRIKRDRAYKGRRVGEDTIIW